MEIIPLIRCSAVDQPLLKRYGMVQLRVNVECSLSIWYYLGLFTALFELEFNKKKGVLICCKLAYKFQLMNSPKAMTRYFFFRII